MFSSIFMVGAYWAELISFTPAQENRQNSISIGEWQFVKPWVPGSHYNPGDVVVYEGNYYIIRETVDSAPQTPTPASNQGNNYYPISFADSEHIYQPGYPYYLYDVVQHNGVHYYAYITKVEPKPNKNQDWPGNAHGNRYWALVPNYSTTTAYSLGMPVYHSNTDTYYRVIKAKPANVNIAITNTEYFRPMNTEISYFWLGS